MRLYVKIFKTHYTSPDLIGDALSRSRAGNDVQGCTNVARAHGCAKRPSTDPTATERSHEANTGRAQGRLARCASESEHGGRERAKGRHGAASGARLAGAGGPCKPSDASGPKPDREWRARCAPFSARRTSTKHATSGGTSQGGRARALPGAAQARAVNGRAGGSVYGHGLRGSLRPASDMPSLKGAPAESTARQ